MLSGYVIYEGPSQLDSEPIVAVATGMSGPNANPKIGSRVVQIWILRADISPVEAVLTGKDRSVCGMCALRGKAEARRVTERTCYVPVFLAPLSVWNAYTRSTAITAEPRAGAPARPPAYAVASPTEITGLLAGYGVRLGAYGDPAAVPAAIWEAVTARAKFWTGYTHQWRTCDRIYARWCMASCETLDDRSRAHALGYRTFRAIMSDARVSRSEGEIVCPGSAEGGHKATCEQCRVCNGSHSDSRKTDVLITMHGVVASLMKKKQVVGVDF